MKAKKRFLGLFLIMGSLILTGCQKNRVDSALKTKDQEETITPQVTITPNASEPSVTVTATPVQDNGWVSKQKDSILQQKPEYKDYTQFSFPLGKAQMIVFEAPGSDKEDWLNYSVDIWAYGEDWILPVEEGAWVLPDSFGMKELNGKEYFRYDRSYATESVTVMVMLDEKEQLRVIPLMGSLIETKGKDLTVVQSYYDLVYSKVDQMATGHTWKPYYYYLEDYEIYEYLASELSQEEFMQYEGAKDIIDQIKKEYQRPEEQLNIEFQKRENDLIHLNIKLESKDDITFYYQTYTINKDQTLSKLGNGEGTYGTLPEVETDSEDIVNIEADVIAKHGEMDEVIDTRFVKFSNNSIKVEKIEWLSPGSEEDRSRIQELLDQGKIVIEEDIWQMEFYIYSNSEDETVYQLAEDAKILVLENGIEYKSYDVSKMNELDKNRLFTIYVKGNVVYLMSEIYTP